MLIITNQSNDNDNNGYFTVDMMTITRAICAFSMGISWKWGLQTIL